MATTRFSHSMTRNSDLTKSRPKYTAASGLTKTTFLTHFSDKNKFHGISDHFGHFRKYFQFLNCTSGPRFRFCAPDVLIESISSRLCAIRRQYEAEYGNSSLDQLYVAQYCARRIFSLVIFIGRSLKFMVPSFYNQTRYANDTCVNCSPSCVVSQKEIRSGIPCLLVEIHVAQYGFRRIFHTRKSHFSCFFSNFERNLFELHNSDFFKISESFAGCRYYRSA